MKCRHGAGHIPPWDRIENPESNLHIYAKLTFNGDPKATQQGKDRLKSGAYFLGQHTGWLDPVSLMFFTQNDLQNKK